MIIVKLQGGLGNQMFQYALGRSLSLRHNVQLKIDSSYLRSPNQSNRSYELDSLAINPEEAMPEEIRAYIGTVQKIFDHLRPNLKKKHFTEKSPAFEKSVLNLNNIYLDGHWQDERYFKDCEQTIRNDFILKNPFGLKAKSVAEQIETVPNAVSLHIRRGDLVSIPKIATAHGTLPLAYYREATAKILELAPNASFFIFSDDIEWAKENFPKDYPVTFVSTAGIRNCEEITLMSMCKHNIIANSTFSWWGAWLNQNPNKIVIAPKQWFRNPSRLTPNLIATTWIRL